MMRLLRVLVLCIAAAGAEPEIDQQHQYPKRSNDDAALLEWGSSAIIHNADGVVAACSLAAFGPSAVHPEFELGIEALIVTASPRQGCETLTNARSVETQIVVMVRGGCSYARKARMAADAGAAALIVVNNDRRSPDRAFAMTASGEDEEALVAPDFNLPCVMVSYAAGQQLREHSPRRMRVFGGGGRPFIESVADAQPVLYLVHNAISDEEIAAARAKLAPGLAAGGGAQQAAPGGFPSVDRSHRHLGPLFRGHDLTQFYERIASIVGYPVEYLSEAVLERRTGAAPYQVRDDRRLSSFGPGRDDARVQVVMTVYVYLDDIPAHQGGAIYFPRAQPAPVSVQPRKGLAAVFYSALEDNTLDRSAAHGEGTLSADAEAWILKLRVYSHPRPFPRRVILPLVTAPWAGAPPKRLTLALGDAFVRFFGRRADAAIDAGLLALTATIALPILLLLVLVAKKWEEARAPPKRKTSSSPAPTNDAAATKKKKRN